MNEPTLDADQSPTPGASDEAARRQAVEAIYAFAAGLMRDGASNKSITQSLVDKGLDAESAAAVVDNLSRMRSEQAAAAGRQNMLYGALWCVGGIVVTVVTLSMAAGGGTYVVAWGAILFGAIQFVRGLIQSAG